MHWTEPSEIEDADARSSEQELSIQDVEKTDETGRRCRMVAVRKDLAVHGLEGDIRHGGQVNSYYDDPHDANRKCAAEQGIVIAPSRLMR